MINKQKLAKAIRIATVPPFLVFLLFVILFCLKKDIFRNTLDFIVSIVCFAVLPLLAYPLQKLFRKTKISSRDMQRNLAFIFNFLGYLFATIYGIFSHALPGLLLIYYGYFISVLILIFANKVLKIRVSGHACSIMGTLTFLVYFMGISYAVPCLCVLTLVYWSSLELKRHTLIELIYGCTVTLISFGLSFAIV